MSRDNFTQSTKEILGQSVGFNCVRPGCARPTTALNSNTGNISRLGFAAHDSAAARGGPRFNENLTSEQRKALENGAHLCPSCARLVDIDPERFPPGALSTWQKNAIAYRQQRMNMPHPPVGLDFRAGCEGAVKFLNVFQRIKIDEWQKSVSWKSLCSMEELIRHAYPMSATNPFCAQFPHMVNLQLEIIESIKLLINEVKYSNKWIYDNNLHSFFLIKINPIFPTPQEEEQKKATDRSFMLVKSRFDDCMANANELRTIANSPYTTIDLYGW